MPIDHKLNVMEHVRSVAKLQLPISRYIRYAKRIHSRKKFETSHEDGNRDYATGAMVCGLGDEGVASSGRVDEADTIRVPVDLRLA